MIINETYCLIVTDKNKYTELLVFLRQKLHKGELKSKSLYKIEEELIPRMRMKWKSSYEPNPVEERDITTIGNNNIHLLSYAIPEIENSIRRLSFQRSPKSTKER
jgi:hypothetical protein